MEQCSISISYHCCMQCIVFMMLRKKISPRISVLRKLLFSYWFDFFAQKKMVSETGPHGSHIKEIFVRKTYFQLEQA